MQNRNGVVFVHVDTNRFRMVGFPTDDRIFARLWQNEITQPANAINIISVDIASWKIGEILLDGRERLGTFVGSKSVGIANGFFDSGGIESPELQRVVHSGRDNLATLQIEIGADDFVSVAFDSTENRDAVIGSDIPKSNGVILWNGQEQIRVGRVEFQFVDGVSVTWNLS